MSHATLFPETQADHADQMDFSSQGETTVVSGNLYDKDFTDALDARYGGAPKKLGSVAGTSAIEEVPLLKP